MKRVVGLGNAVVDYTATVPDSFLAAQGLRKGDAVSMSIEQFENVVNQLPSSCSECICAGSVANSLFMMAGLGREVALCSRLGDDAVGQMYKDNAETFMVKIVNPLEPGETTGRCLVLVTPDGERTMIAALGASADLSATELDESLLSSETVLFLEAYSLDTPTGPDTVQAVVGKARQAGASVAFTLSSAALVERHRDYLLTLLPQVDLVFCNREEAFALFASEPVVQGTCPGITGCLARLEELCAHAVITDGASGCYVAYEGVHHLVPAYPVRPVDTTGAGDAFAGVYLHGVLAGLAVSEAARRANWIVRTLVQGHGAKIQADVQELWYTDPVSAAEASVILPKDMDAYTQYVAEALG